MIYVGMVLESDHNRIGITRVLNNMVYFQVISNETGDGEGYVWCLPVEYLLLNYMEI